MCVVLHSSYFDVDIIMNDCQRVLLYLEFENLNFRIRDVKRHSCLKACAELFL